ncbi:hypothetical protein OGAPHI_001668 [Ogataea philodendri]|uniref:Glu-AdT subunit F n=1 Tax=Ogataea philodendri TaxID=1378263 RepID=A0A9P8PD30_9ASCO|nr:uncharacterized protein OGAPHI_001668 [Ogataea philodendri]KAH3669072.1 hypothetical protein OGAPHI_001668 [Ogataea philodendri]
MLPLIRQIACRRYKSSIGKQLATAEDLKSFFKSSVAVAPPGVERSAVKPELLDKLLDLSGLSKEISQSEQQSLLDSLSDQLQFVAELKNHKPSPNQTRLVQDSQPLKFDQLVDEIAQQTPQLAKGEVEECWNPLDLSQQHQDDYFVVKEGLIKEIKQ